MTSRIESLVDYGTSAIAGGASGYCCALLVASPIAPVAAGSAGFLGILALMKRIGARPAPLPALEPIPLPEFEEADELLLEDAAGEDELILEVEAPMAVSEAQARIASAFDALGPSKDESELLLDAPLEESRSNRVVALFGGEYSQGADPAEIKARIDEHLAARNEARSPASGPVELVPDASEALAAALKGLGRDKA